MFEVKEFYLDAIVDNIKEQWRGKKLNLSDQDLDVLNESVTGVDQLDSMG